MIKGLLDYFLVNVKNKTNSNIFYNIIINHNNFFNHIYS